MRRGGVGTIACQSCLHWPTAEMPPEPQIDNINPPDTKSRASLAHPTHAMHLPVRGSLKVTDWELAADAPAPPAAPIAMVPSSFLHRGRLERFTEALKHFKFVKTGLRADIAVAFASPRERPTKGIRPLLHAGPSPQTRCEPSRRMVQLQRTIMRAYLDSA